MKEGRKVLEVYAGEAKVQWGREMVTFPIMRKAENKEEAKKLLVDQICRGLNVDPENIVYLKLRSFWE